MLDNTVLGMIGAFKQRHHRFTEADRFGANAFYNDFLKAIARRGIVNEIHLFPEGTAHKSADFEDDELGEFCASNTRVSRYLISELPKLADQNPYIFVCGGPQIARLGRGRITMKRRFPIATIIHSTLWDSFPFGYIDAILSARPYDRLIVTSEAGRVAVDSAITESSKWLSAELNGVSVDCLKDRLKRVLIPLGVECQDFDQIDKQSARRLLNIRQESTVFLYIGRFAPFFKADLDPLLLVFKRLSDQNSNLLLLLAGAAENAENVKVEEMCTRLGLSDRVKILPNFAPVLKTLLYSASDVFVSPADNLQETFGIALIEAMSAGLPVIATNWSGYRDLVEHNKTGFLVRSFWNTEASAFNGTLGPLLYPFERAKFMSSRTFISTSDLYEYMFVLAHNSQLRAEMGSIGKKRALDLFSWDVVVPLFRDLWEMQLAEFHQSKSHDEELFAQSSFDAHYAHFASDVMAQDDLLHVDHDYLEQLTQVSAEAQAHVAALGDVSQLNDRPACELFNEEPSRRDAALFLLKKGVISMLKVNDLPAAVEGKVGE